MDEEKLFYTVEETAARLTKVGMKFSARTVRDWIEKGKLKAKRPGARTWYIPISEVERIIKEVE